VKATQAGKGYNIPAPKTRHRDILLVENEDGTFNILEDTPKALLAYHPRRDEKTSLHRAFVRRQP
jgi:hypothetical protein